jgi:2-phospho-L-lactate/phosphoenolpyruvate guanylyltransferase
MIPVILVTAKDPSRAKQRLAGRLNRDHRAELARVMWLDLSRALSGVSCPVAVVTDSEEFAANAGALGWRVVEDPDSISESRAVDHASGLLERDGFDAVLRLPADIPLAGRDDIETLLASPPGTPFARLVPSRDGTGTNAILRSPPSLFPSRFGSDSLTLHIQECHRAGVEPEVVENARIALDIDEPDDLRRLLESGEGTLTHRWLCETATEFAPEAGSRD